MTRSLICSQRAHHETAHDQQYWSRSTGPARLQEKLTAEKQKQQRWRRPGCRPHTLEVPIMHLDGLVHYSPPPLVIISWYWSLTDWSVYQCLLDTGSQIDLSLHRPVEQEAPVCRPRWRTARWTASTNQVSSWNDAFKCNNTKLEKWTLWSAAKWKNWINKKSEVSEGSAASLTSVSVGFQSSDQWLKITKEHLLEYCT